MTEPERRIVKFYSPLLNEPVEAGELTNDPELQSILDYIRQLRLTTERETIDVETKDRL